MIFMIGDIVRAEKFGIQGVIKNIRCEWCHGHFLTVLDFEDGGNWLGHHFALVKRPFFNKLKKLWDALKQLRRINDGALS